MRFVAATVIHGRAGSWIGPLKSLLLPRTARHVVLCAALVFVRSEPVPIARDVAALGVKGANIEPFIAPNLLLNVFTFGILAPCEVPVIATSQEGTNERYQPYTECNQRNGQREKHTEGDDSKRVGDLFELVSHLSREIDL